MPPASDHLPPSSTTSKKTMPGGFLNKLMAKAYPPPSALTPHATDNNHYSSSEEEQEEEHQQELLLRTPASSHSPSQVSSTSRSTSSYSLTSGPLHSRRSHPSTPSCSSRGRNNSPFPAPSSSPSTTGCISANHHEILWEEQHSHPQQDEIASINPTVHMKVLLTQLASGITALVRSLSRNSNLVDEAYRKADRTVEEEIQALSDIHVRLYNLVQEQEFLTKQGMSYEAYGAEPNVGLKAANAAERQEMTLKSYEGVIARFHDEIRKKDAVIEALKETLAKSLLKNEKLERRIKASEMKLC